MQLGLNSSTGKDVRGIFLALAALSRFPGFSAHDDLLTSALGSNSAAFADLSLSPHPSV